MKINIDDEIEKELEKSLEEEIADRFKMRNEKSKFFNNRGYFEKMEKISKKGE